VDAVAQRAESSQVADMDLSWEILVVLPYTKVVFLK
jgi:hypothetical protein